MNASLLLRIVAMAALMPLLTLTACSGGASPTAPMTPQSAGCGAAHPFSVQTYGDPFHVHPKCTFDVASNAAAYVVVNNVAPADRYVTYAESLGADPSCVFMSPSGKIAQPHVCDPKTANVNGAHAPSGTLLITWPLDLHLKSGPYAIYVYDRDSGVRGSVQVTLTTP